MRWQIGLAILSLGWPLTAAGQPASTPASKSGEGLFSGQVRKILSETCVRCHNADQKKGGPRPQPPGPGGCEGGKRARRSCRASSRRACCSRRSRRARCPPRAGSRPRRSRRSGRWVAAGAPYPARAGHPAPRRAGLVVAPADPPARGARPSASGDSAWVRTPDRRLHPGQARARKGLSPAPEADRRHPDPPPEFDLIGLPPDARGGRRRSSHDPDPRRLRDGWSIGCSPRPTTASAGAGTGSTWSGSARARATRPTCPGPTPGPIATTSSGAFNRDTPFPRFVLEQLAGDTLADGRLARPQAATGFLVGGHARHRRQPDGRGDAPAAGRRPRRHDHGHRHGVPRA